MGTLLENTWLVDQSQIADGKSKVMNYALWIKDTGTYFVVNLDKDQQLTLNGTGMVFPSQGSSTFPLDISIVSGALILNNSECYLGSHAALNLTLQGDGRLDINGDSLKGGLNIDPLASIRLDDTTSMNIKSPINFNGCGIAINNSSKMFITIPGGGSVF
ncbi:hypothetical protein ACGVWS_13985 [Enterobacteriaceae bacterium LUAb1]